jgi:Flp pilus assembly protein TadB
MTTRSRNCYLISVAGILVAFLITSAVYPPLRAGLLFVIGAAFLLAGLRIRRRRSAGISSAAAEKNEESA